MERGSVPALPSSSRELFLSSAQTCTTIHGSPKYPVLVSEQQRITASEMVNRDLYSLRSVSQGLLSSS